MRSKLFILVLVQTIVVTAVVQAQTFDEDKPIAEYNSRYQQYFNPDSGWNDGVFYNQWSALQPNIFGASDISSGYLQFKWIEKRVICSKKDYSSPYIMETDIDYTGGSNRGGVVIRASAISESLQEPITDPGFNREGIAFYPTIDGASMIVQFSGVDLGYNSSMEIVRVLVPKPEAEASLMSRGKLRIEDFETTIYAYYNDHPFFRIELEGKTENIYTSGTVYDANMQVLGTFSNMEVEATGKVAVAQRDAALRLYSGAIDYNVFIEPVDSGEYRDLYADTWVATDALGRKMPSYEEVGAVKEDKERVVGIFYITWHSEGHFSNFKSPYSADVTKVLKEDPSARLDGDHPLWTTNSYHWGEPEMGYFLSQDEYVIRKDMNMLAVAGVDVLVMDVTNAVRYWEEWEVLFSTMQKMKAEGNQVPEFCFWTFNGPVITVVQELYEYYYKNPKYEDLWFYWDGKPLLLYNSNPTVDATAVNYQNPNPNYDPEAITDVNHPHYGDPDYTDEFYTDYTQEVKDFFTLRTMWWGYYEWAGERFIGTEDNWSFGYDMNDSRVKSMDPDDLVSTHNGRKEQSAVTPAQHPSSLVGKSWRRQTGEPELNQYDMPESAYVPWLDKTVNNPQDYGIYFQDRWDEAIESDPEFIYINDWNEWTAGKYPAGEGTTFPFMRRNSDFFFVDQYNEEFNRGVQPMKDGYTDNYFMQMAQNIRRYKGVRPAPEIKGFDPITIDGQFTDWESVVNEFQDVKGDTYHRDHKGYGGLRYTNTTGRNDILTSRVTYNSQNIYFYVKTAQSISHALDPNWMLLLLDVDKNYGTGWEGYDFIVNYEVKSSGQTTVKQWDGKNWTNEVIIPYAVSEEALELSIPRSALMLEEDTPEFYFKWADNPQHLNDITAFFTDGDAAPDRRFNYNFSSSEIEVQEQAAYKDLSIPGTIEFEDFDSGGAGIAYADADMANNGGKYRPEESVDIDQADDGGYFISWTNNNEWLEYTVNVKAIGLFKATIHYASETGDNKVLFSLDDFTKTDTIVLPATGGPRNWSSYDVNIKLTSGRKIMKFSIANASDSFKLDKIVFTEQNVVYPGTGEGLQRTLWTGEVGGRNWFVDSICTETDPVIDEVWGLSGPGCGVENDYWNARWSGEIEPLFTEEYTFYLTAKNLGRLWINDNLIIDSWTSTTADQTRSGKISLVAGQKVNVRVDFAKKTGEAKIKLEWESMNNPREIVPKNQLYSEWVTSSGPLKNSSIQIYPNPATSQITIEANDQLISAIMIYDVYGKSVFISEEVITNTKTLNINYLPSGIYMIKAICDSHTNVLRFIKE